MIENVHGRCYQLLALIGIATAAPHILLVGRDQNDTQTVAQTYTPLDGHDVAFDAELPDSPEAAVVGNRAYIVSGQDLFIYDPRVNRTSFGEPMLKYRQFFTATAMRARIFVCGGRYPHWEIYLPTCEFYNTLTNEWSREVKRMRWGRGHHAAVAVKDRLYVMGGQRALGSSLIIYDEKRNKWFTGADMPYSAQDHAAIALGAHIFTCGGGSEDGVKIASCAGYNIRTNRWYVMAPLTRPRVLHEMVVWNGSPMVLGGLWDSKESLSDGLPRIGSIERGLWDGEPTEIVEYYDWIHNRTLLLRAELARPTSKFAAVLLF